MAFPTFVSAGTAASTATTPYPQFRSAGTVGSGTAGVTPGLPSGAVANDILLLVVQSSNQAITAPSGYVEVTNSPQGTGTAVAAGSVRLGVFWKRHSGSESAPTVADTGDHTIARIYAFSGCVTSGDPWDITSGDVAATASTSFTIPAVTTTVVNTLLVGIVANAVDSTTTPQVSAWNQMGSLSLGANTNSGTGGGFDVATQTQSATGSSGTKTGTVASTKQARMLIALKPVSGAGVVTPGLPSGWQQNDILVMFAESNFGVTEPSGWTQPSFGTSDGNTLLQMLYKVAGPSESAPTVTNTGDHTVAQILAFRGASTSSTFSSGSANSGVQGTPGTSVSVSTSGSTTADNNCLVIFGVSNSTDTATPQGSGWANSSLANVTELADTNVTDGGGGGFTIISGELATAGAMGTLTGTLATSSDYSYIFGGLVLGPTSGSVIVTETSDTASASGSAGLRGPGSATETDDTASASGLAGIRGPAAVSETGDTAAASGTSILNATGSAPITEASDTASASGLQKFTGTVAVTETSDTATATGAETITGAAAATESADTVSGTGAEIFTGTASSTEASDTASATGTVGNSNATGTIAVTEANDTASASATLLLSGSASPSEGSDTASGSAVLTFTGSGAVTEANDTAVATGLLTVNGTVSVTEQGDSASGSGTLAISGTTGIAETSDTASATGTSIFTVTGALAVIESDDSATASGLLVIFGSATITESGDSSASAAQQLVPSGRNVIYIRAQTRIVYVGVGNRVLAVANDNRGFSVAAENRTVAAQTETRLIQVAA